MFRIFLNNMPHPYLDCEEIIAAGQGILYKVDAESRQVRLMGEHIREIAFIPNA